MGLISDITKVITNSKEELSSKVGSVNDDVLTFLSKVFDKARHDLSFGRYVSDFIAKKLYVKSSFDTIPDLEEDNAFKTLRENIYFALTGEPVFNQKAKTTLFQRVVYFTLFISALLFIMKKLNVLE